jgi:hypothetical protein
MIPLGLATKLGFHPLTKAVLVVISTSPPNDTTYRSIAIEDSCNALVGLCCLVYVLETI